MSKTHHTHQCSASLVSLIAASVLAAVAENTVVENFWSAFSMRLLLAPLHLNSIFVLQFARLASLKKKCGDSSILALCDVPTLVITHCCCRVASGPRAASSRWSRIQLILRI